MKDLPRRRPTTLEEKATQFCVDYWYLPEEGSKYQNKWEKMRASLRDRDETTVVRMWREAMTQSYLAGVTLRLTEGEG